MMCSRIKKKKKKKLVRQALLLNLLSHETFFKCNKSDFINRKETLFFQKKKKLFHTANFFFWEIAACFELSWFAADVCQHFYEMNNKFTRIFKFIF